MNRLQKEALALQECTKIYLRYRSNLDSYLNDWMLEKKGKEFNTWYKNWRPGLNKFRNKFKGEDCFIIGNGPSLNEMDLDVLNDYYTFGLNKIYLLFGRSDFRPKFHVTVNKHVIEQSIHEILKINIPSFISFTRSEQIVNSPNLNYLFTVGGVEQFCGDIQKTISEGGTVTYVAMQVAYYMGFKNIYLIGVDHNFKQKGVPNSEEVMEGPDVNHFDPNYFSGQKWNLADLKSSEYGYNLAKYYFQYHDRQILNATLGGKLEIFPRVNFKDALKKAKKIT